MNFSPHHAFAACDRLERTIIGLKANGGVPDPVFDSYERYHFSLIHKLRSAKYHVESLEGFLSSGAPLTPDPADIVYRVNFHFDGFLYCVGSGMDIFAYEVLGYFSIPLPPKVYFHTAHTEILAARPGDQILPMLTDPTWKLEFSKYRNTATHEKLIGIEYTRRTVLKGSVPSDSITFPIPDDPRGAAYTCRNNPDIVAYCKKTFKRAVSLFNQVYAHMEGRARTAGTFPL